MLAGWSRAVARKQEKEPLSTLSQQRQELQLKLAELENQFQKAKDELGEDHETTKTWDAQINDIIRKLDVRSLRNPSVRTEQSKQEQGLNLLYSPLLDQLEGIRIDQIATEAQLAFIKKQLHKSLELIEVAEDMRENEQRIAHQRQLYQNMDKALIDLRIQRQLIQQPQVTVIK
jgi:hypothetical protein